MSAERSLSSTPPRQSILKIAVDEGAIIARHNWQVDVIGSDMGRRLRRGIVANVIVSRDAQDVIGLRGGCDKRGRGRRCARQPWLPVGIGRATIFESVGGHTGGSIVGRPGDQELCLGDMARRRNRDVCGHGDVAHIGDDDSGPLAIRVGDGVGHAGIVSAAGFHAVGDLSQPGRYSRGTSLRRIVKGRPGGQGQRRRAARKPQDEQATVLIGDVDVAPGHGHAHDIPRCVVEAHLRRVCWRGHVHHPQATTIPIGDVGVVPGNVNSSHNAGQWGRLADHGW